MENSGIKGIVRKTYLILCLSIVLYMGIEQKVKFLKNEDSSSLEWKRFHKDEKDNYPTFSICFRHIYDENKIKDSLNITAQTYKEILYGYALTKNKIFNISKIPILDFDVATLDGLNNTAKTYWTITNRDDYVNKWTYNKNNLNSSQFYKSFQNPYAVCYSKNTKFVPNQTIRRQTIVFKKIPELKDKRTPILIYFQAPGQLIRHVTKYSMEIDKSTLETKDEFYFYIQHIQVLRRRQDSNVPCDYTLQNDDQKWQQTVIKSIGCVPVYWRDDKNKKASYKYGKHRVCNTAEEYKNLYNYWVRYTNTWNATLQYQRPCTNMNIIMRSESHKAATSSYVYFNVDFLIEEYEEITNKM